MIRSIAFQVRPIGRRSCGRHPGRLRNFDPSKLRTGCRHFGIPPADRHDSVRRFEQMDRVAMQIVRGTASTAERTIRRASGPG